MPRPAGVQLRGGRTIHARQAVVSNASSPDTLRLLPAEAVPPAWQQSVQDTPLCPSFLHLHLGFEATGEGWCTEGWRLADADAGGVMPARRLQELISLLELCAQPTCVVPVQDAASCLASSPTLLCAAPPSSLPLPLSPPSPPCAGLDGLELHHIVVNDWDLPGGVAAPQNVVLISIASGKERGVGGRVLAAGRAGAGHLRHTRRISKRKQGPYEHSIWQPPCARLIGRHPTHRTGLQ